MDGWVDGWMDGWKYRKVGVLSKYGIRSLTFRWKALPYKVFRVLEVYKPFYISIHIHTLCSLNIISSFCSPVVSRTRRINNM